MPTVFYHPYMPAADSIPAITAQEHRLGRRLLCEGLSTLYRLSFSEDTVEEQLCKDENGKPFLKDFPQIHFNITHCSGLAACAFHSSPIGVDAELPGYFAPILIRKVLAEEEAHLLSEKGTDHVSRDEWFFRLWTLKEAYVKMTGTGVDVPLRDFSFSFGEDGEIACSDRTAACFQKKLESGHILSLCVNSGSDSAPVQLIRSRSGGTGF